MDKWFLLGLWLSENTAQFITTMTGMLASVTGREEAAQALQAGVDLIDFKNPSSGALGALPVSVVRSAVDDLRRRVATSATVGDLPLDPGIWCEAVRRMATSGVDYVKLGLFPGLALAEHLSALRPLTGSVRLVVVLFADRQPDFDLLPAIRAAGCAGVMLDTADKQGGRLTDYLDRMMLTRFIRQTRTLGLLTGLAGSLRLDDIPDLLPLVPDFLGFRGALCGGDRTDRLDPAALARVRAAIPALPRVASA